MYMQVLSETNPQWDKQRRQQSKRPAGRWGSSPKPAVAFTEVPVLLQVLHPSWSKLWFRGKKIGSIISVTVSAYNITSTIACLPLLSRRRSQDICWQTFSGFFHWWSTYKTKACIWTRGNKEDKTWSNSLFFLLIPGLERLPKCSFRSLSTLKCESQGRS